MKNLLFVSVALSVFTVTSVTAQKKSNFLADMNLKGDGIVYVPSEQTTSYHSSTFVNFTKRVVVPAVKITTEFCSPLQFKYAQILNREVESLLDVALFSFIDEWWATRYRYGGTGKTGIDCSAFTGKLFSTVFGIVMPRTAREQYALCNKLKRDDMLEGDLVFFNTTGGVSHVGVYLGDGYFVHSSCSRGVTISSLNESYYNKKFIAGGRPITEDYTAGTGN